MPPTHALGNLPPVMDNIYKKSKYRKVSLTGPLYVMEERKKSASLSSLIAEDENWNPLWVEKRPFKSNSVMHIKRGRDDLHLPQYRHSEHTTTTKKIDQRKSRVFDYDRILREEKKEFEFRLADIPKASGHINDFQVIKLLASGQFGRVYLAEDVMDKKEYAIKTISKDVIYRNNLLADVEAERDYLYATNSPFIVSLIHHFEDDQRVYFVEEFVTNGDLYEVLKHTGPFSESLTRFHASQVVLALEYLHNVNLIYRDLKPENVMIASNGYIKLVDFGFVKRVENKTNTMVGTPAYMAPEMVISRPYDKTIDWWSLGILIYEMLAGCQITPFTNPSRKIMYDNIQTKEVTFPHSNQFPYSGVRDLIKRLLKKNPTQRLGNGQNGSQDVKNHPWFASMKWVELYRRTLTPPVKSKSSAPKYQKVAALQQRLLGGRPTGATNKLHADTIQNRLRLEKFLKIR